MNGDMSDTNQCTLRLVCTACPITYAYTVPRNSSVCSPAYNAQTMCRYTTL